MATRFDRVTTPVRDARSRTSDLLDSFDLEVRELVRHAHSGLPTGEQPRAVPTRALWVAMSAWLSMVFSTCYVGLPLALATLGIDTGVLSSSFFALPAFVMASFVAVIGAAVARPEIRLATAGPRDPVVSAALGGLVTLAIVHNTSPFLLPFASMSAVGLTAFLALNVLEMTLLGMMFASFTRSRLVAAALGSGFQLLVLGLVTTLLRLALL